MKQTKVETGDVHGKITQSIPPPPPLPSLWVRKKVAESVTKQEIAKFWRKKLVEEEDHFLAAIKAAARIRARNLSEVDYKQFEESLKDDYDAKENDSTSLNSNKDTSNNEVRVGIKDWWTKSKYAYLNQPAIKSKDPPQRRSSSYTPNYFSFKPTAPLYPTSLASDVFHEWDSEESTCDNSDKSILISESFVLI
ncbi:DNA polymerase EPSILON CATALYTIC SUBUNIT A [Salix viminalis]|uniref:DNA polymerase EPSILON CATALYTIC SUBUNIT A n=1 Tax=Salix viminalis TaxID=40686 RepID=A0A9Q0UVG5_SALVM|nr:DNA polymerase EPSILON CATALYTIC SUBUNIT A [Salix viminalis]